MIRKHTLISILFFILTPLLFSRCVRLPWLEKDTIPQYVTYTVPKWKLIGILSEETPNVTRVLKRYTGYIGAAITIIESNQWKYNEKFFKVLPFGASIYISEDGELFINPRGGKAPDTIIIKRKLNPEYSTIKNRSSRKSHMRDNARKGSIIEEDLTE